MIKINSISDIVDKYDNFIIDQWGVMHDGTSGYIHAIKTINYLKKKIRTYLLFLILQKDKNRLKKNFQN